MSFDKAIRYGKEYRHEYRDSRAFDRSCRNHGSCKWCECNRRFNALKLEEKFKQDMEEYYDTDTEVYDPESDYDDRV